MIWGDSKRGSPADRFGRFGSTGPLGETVTVRFVRFPDGTLVVPVLRRDLTMTGPVGAVIMVLGTAEKLASLKEFLCAALAESKIELSRANLDGLAVAAEVMASYAPGAPSDPESAVKAAAATDVGDSLKTPPHTGAGSDVSDTGDADGLEGQSLVDMVLGMKRQLLVQDTTNTTLLRRLDASEMRAAEARQAMQKDIDMLLDAAASSVVS